MKVALMITCMADTLRPSIGRAAVHLLRRLGCEVVFPEAQTCCGQPFYNSGFTSQAAAVARNTIDTFRLDCPVVVPSGSCAAMVRLEYPHLFPEEPSVAAAASELAARTYELSEFLVERLGVVDVGARYAGRIAYHSACHLRGLGPAAQASPGKLLAAVKEAVVVPTPGQEQCCGFGGSFAVRYHEISQAMVSAKAEAFRGVQADAVVSTDSGCLVNIEGRMRRLGMKVEALHLAELLERR